MLRIIYHQRLFHCSRQTLSLLKFFDSPTGWTWQTPKTGPSWQASHLRQKSFEDLQELWWSCLIERNKLVSQEQEGRRFKIYFPNGERVQQVKLTMKRIKLVLWERRIASLQAKEILRQELQREKEEGLKKISESSSGTDAITSSDSKVDSTETSNSTDSNSTTKDTLISDELLWIGRRKPSQAYKSKVTRQKRTKKTTSWAIE